MTLVQRKASAVPAIIRVLSNGTRVNHTALPFKNSDRLLLEKKLTILGFTAAVEIGDGITFNRSNGARVRANVIKFQEKIRRRLL